MIDRTKAQKIIECILNPLSGFKNIKGGFTVNELKEKFGVSKRYIRKQIIRPLKQMKLLVSFKVEDDPRQKRYFINKQDLMIKLVQKGVRTKRGREETNLFTYIVEKEKITATNMQKELGWNYDKIKKTLDRLKQQKLIEKIDDKTYIKNPKKFGEMFLTKPLKMFKNEIMREFELQEEPTTEQLKEAMAKVADSLKK